MTDHELNELEHLLENHTPVEIIKQLYLIAKQHEWKTDAIHLWIAFSALEDELKGKQR